MLGLIKMVSMLDSRSALMACEPMHPSPSGQISLRSPSTFEGEPTRIVEFACLPNAQAPASNHQHLLDVWLLQLRQHPSADGPRQLARRPERRLDDILVDGTGR